jgi:hypothetical protein
MMCQYAVILRVIMLSISLFYVTQGVITLNFMLEVHVAVMLSVETLGVIKVLH